MPTERQIRARDRIAVVASGAHDLVTFWREVSHELTTTVPHYASPCWYTLDPASLLMTSHFNEDMATLPPEWLTAEYVEDDVHKLVDVARSRSGISTLHEATGGDPSSSPRWAENMRFGADQELLCALRTRDGDTWGALGLYREPDTPLFDRDDLAFVQSIASSLAEGARRSLLLAAAREPDSIDPPGMVVLSSDFEIESMTPGMQERLADLPEGDRSLPPSVIAVASQALRASGSEGSADGAMARVRSRTGTWFALHGLVLSASPRDRVAVIVERAQPARILPLLLSAYGLTGREQEVTRLVLQGNSTAEIASTLCISAHTVQDHLKRIFEKTEVRSRRDLVAKVFFNQYEPRVRDNEDRAAQGRSVRPGPMASARP